MELNKFNKALMITVLSTSIAACNNGYSDNASIATPSVSAKVQNGTLVKDKFLNSTVPMILMMSHGSVSICTGTLINKDTVLTAAHCALSMGTKAVNKTYTNKDVIKSDEIMVFLSKDPSKAIDLSKISLDKISDVVDVYTIKNIYVHQYAFRGAKVNKDGFNLIDGGDLNDLAILKLSTSAPDDYGFPALATKNPKPNSKELIVGYGVNIGDGVKITDKAKGDSGVLRKSDSIFIDSSHDGKLLDVGGFVKRGKKSVYTKICQGDSGGPDFQSIKGNYVITGVHSFGDGDNCGEADTPSTSISVASYNSWISGGYETQSIK